MIKIYREKDSSQADRIEAEFQDVLLGYEREILTPEEAERRFGAGHRLPVITNNEIIASGPVNEVFTEQNLRKAYGGKVAFLSAEGNGKNGKH